MPLASGAGSSSSAAQRGLNPQQEAGRVSRLLAEQQAKSGNGGNVSGSGAGASGSGGGVPQPSTKQMEPPTGGSGGSNGTQNKTQQEAARVAQLVQQRRPVIPSSQGTGARNEEAPVEEDSSDDGYSGAEDDGSEEGAGGYENEGYDDDSSLEHTPSVMDASQFGDEFDEDMSMREKQEAAAKRQQLFSGEGSSSERTQTTDPQSSSSGEGLGSSQRPSSRDQARQTVNQGFAGFQRDVQDAKRKKDIASEQSNAQLLANGSDTLKNINTLKNRLIKLRDLITTGTGVGIVYYIGKMDITIINRYFLKRKYVWGYRDPQEYESNKMARFNDNLDLVEWIVLFLIRIVSTAIPIIILIIILFTASLIGQPLLNLFNVMR